MSIRRDRFRNPNTLPKKGLIDLMAFVLALAFIFGITVHTAYQHWNHDAPLHQLAVRTTAK